MFKEVNMENFIIKQKGLKNKINEDSLWLCSFIEQDLNQKKVVELGSGSGLISIFIEKNFEVKEVVSVEVEDVAFEALEKNIKINKCRKIKAHKGDIKKLKNNLNPASYDSIVTNPPYYKIGHGKQPLSREIMCNMQDIFKISSYLLTKTGSLIICYPKTRDQELLANAENFKFKLVEKKSNNKINFYRLIKDQ